VYEKSRYLLPIFCASGSAAEANGVDVEKVKAHLTLEEDEHQHYSQRAPWLRAGVAECNV